jgi:hypothetical protein
MKKILLISTDIYFKIDFKFYQKYDTHFLSLNDVNKNYNFSEFESVICVIDALTFDNISKTGYPFNSIHHQNDDFFDKNPYTFFDNFNYFYKNFPKNTKYIFYDNDTEAEQKSVTKFILKWVESDSNNYFITSRQKDSIHQNIISELIYLPIIYAFYIDNFYKYPMLEIPIIKNSKYDFVTYLGHTSKSDKIEFRLNFLKQIFNNNIDKIKYKHLNFVDNETMGNGNDGHFWNLLNSLSAKIQIIFETVNPLENWYSDDWLTEKTMKCFLLPQPYILLLQPIPLTLLEKYGFKFALKCNSIDEYKNSIDYIKNNVDIWVEENEEIFYHNQNNFYKMIESSELPHHNFMEKIINNKL